MHVLFVGVTPPEQLPDAVKRTVVASEAEAFSVLARVPAEAIVAPASARGVMAKVARALPAALRILVGEPEDVGSVSIEVVASGAVDHFLIAPVTADRFVDVLKRGRTEHVRSQDVVLSVCTADVIAV